MRNDQGILASSDWLRWMGEYGADPSRYGAPMPPISNQVTIRLLVDRGQLEVFGNDGQTVITERVYPGLVWMSLHFAEAKVNWLTHDVGDPLPVVAQCHPQPDLVTARRVHLI